MHKGSVTDLAVVIVLIFIIAISSLAALTILNAFNSKLQGNPSVNNTQAANLSQQITNNSFGALDTMFPFIFVMANIAVFFFSFQVKSHPIFFALSVLALVVVLVVVAAGSNAYQMMAASTQLAGAASKMALTTMVMTNLLPIQAAFGFIDMIVLYAIGSRTD
jgi:membrane-associated HD superfamily phosphohydrolase